MGSWFKVLGHWDMHTIVSYLSAFWTVVVMNCIHPVNWKYCYRVDQWLVPQVIEGLEILNNPDIIYKTEREYLNNINIGD